MKELYKFRQSLSESVISEEQKIMTGLKFLQANIEETNIPEEHWENEIGEMMEEYAIYYHEQKMKSFNNVG